MAPESMRDHGALFGERRLVEHRSWRHAFLYGFQELKAQTRWLDLMERLCRVAEEEGVELVGHFLRKDAGGEGRGGRGRGGWRKGRDGWCTVSSRWSSW